MGASMIPSNSVDTSLLGGGGHVFILPFKPIGVVQGTWTPSLNVACYPDFYLVNTTTAINDECYFYVQLSQGTYTLQILHRQQSDAGIVKFFLDATQIAAFDYYKAGGGVDNYYQEQTGIVITAGKLFKLTLRINTKNAASSSYISRTQCINFIKTA